MDAPEGTLTMLFSDSEGSTLLAAAVIQRGFAQHPWPGAALVRDRIGLHNVA